MNGPSGYSQSGSSQGGGAAAVLNNPLTALLTPERQQVLASLSDMERQLFFGRVLESVFSNATYQQLVFSTANYHLDQLAAEKGRGGSMGGGAAAGSMGGGATGGGATGGDGPVMLA